MLLWGSQDLIILYLENRLDLPGEQREYNQYVTWFFLVKSGVDHDEILVSNVKALSAVLGKCILLGSLIEN